MPQHDRILNYAGPEEEAVDLSWIRRLVIGAIGLSCAGVYTAAYEGSEEPFFGPATPTDIFVFRIFPVLLAVGWLGWFILVWLRAPSRKAALILFATALPFVAISGYMVLETRANFESQQRAAAFWQQPSPPVLTHSPDHRAADITQRREDAETSR